jgi:hypothetical protein
MISERNAANDLPRPDIKTSVWNVNLFCNVEKDMKRILLFDICIFSSAVFSSGENHVIIKRRPQFFALQPQSQMPSTLLDDNWNQARGEFLT